MDKIKSNKTFTLYLTPSLCFCSLTLFEPPLSSFFFFEGQGSIFWPSVQWVLYTWKNCRMSIFKLQTLDSFNTSPPIKSPAVQTWLCLSRSWAVSFFWRPATHAVTLCAMAIRRFLWRNDDWFAPALFNSFFYDLNTQGGAKLFCSERGLVRLSDKEITIRI